MHGCTSRLLEEILVHEKFHGQTVWEGAVHVFDVDHPKAKTCFAWTSPVEGSERRKFYAVLAIPPVFTAQDAVRAAIVADNKNEET